MSKEVAELHLNEWNHWGSAREYNRWGNWRILVYEDIMLEWSILYGFELDQANLCQPRPASSHMQLHRLLDTIPTSWTPEWSTVCWIPKPTRWTPERSADYWTHEPTRWTPEWSTDCWTPSGRQTAGHQSPQGEHQGAPHTAVPAQDSPACIFPKSTAWKLWKFWKYFIGKPYVFANVPPKT